MQNKQGF